METKIIFYSQIQINRYAKKLRQTKNCFYSILNKKKWLFWYQYTVIFYDENSIKDKITTVLYDLIVNEYKIKIHSLNITVLKNDRIQVDLSSDQHALLIGKFGQNHTTIENFLSYVVSFAFFHKWKVMCKISKLNQNQPSNKKVPNVKKLQ